jgi:hypothetical protein
MPVAASTLRRPRVVAVIQVVDSVMAYDDNRPKTFETRRHGENRRKFEDLATPANSYNQKIAQPVLMQDEDNLIWQR